MNAKARTGWQQLIVSEFANVHRDSVWFKYRVPFKRNARRFGR